MTAAPISRLLQRAAENHRAGRLAEAETLCREVLAQEPHHAPALQLLGVVATQVGRAPLAIEILRRVVEIDPQSAGSWNDLGIALREGGKLDEAIVAHQRALQLAPHSAELHNDFGLTLQISGRIDEAMQAYRTAVRIRPDLAVAYSNLGVALTACALFDEAIAACREAVSLQPRNPAALYNLGNAQLEKGLLKEAIDSFEKAVQIVPTHAEALNNLGSALLELGRLDAAVETYRRAVAVRPVCVKAHGNLSAVLLRQGFIEEALDFSSRAVAAAPHHAALRSQRLYGLHYHPGLDAAAILEEHLEWDKYCASDCGTANQTHANAVQPERRLRIGYVSPDFCDHVVGRNLLPLLREHHRGQFEIFCYGNVRRPDIWTEQIRGFSDQWRNLNSIPVARAAEMVRADEIDILVDLTSHSARNNLPLFARKPAPVQVAYLGYCSTTGLSAMDYRLSDPFLDAPEMGFDGYSEKTVRLPRTYWCYESGEAPEVGALPAAGSEFFTFGCLNNFAKVSNAALDLWIEILQMTPRSRFLLHAPEGRGRERVIDRFAHRGIGSERLEFVSQLPRMDYLRSWRKIDIGLDPLPYGGGITTCDALWMGVPVVSLSGRTAVGRSGRSILSNVGLPDLIADTPQRYVEIAASLARDLPRLEELRTTLRPRMQGSPLLDAKGFTRDVEAAYREMWKRWCWERSSK